MYFPMYQFFHLNIEEHHEDVYPDPGSAGLQPGPHSNRAAHAPSWEWEELGGDRGWLKRLVQLQTPGETW